MKHNTILHALMYIFRMPQQETMQIKDFSKQVVADLSEAGFEEATISRAIHWMFDLALNREGQISLVAPQTGSVRVWSDQECQVLDMECRRYLMQLEQRGILDAMSRELVIDRAMALDEVGVDLNVIKWVSMMVLSNLPDHDRPMSDLAELLTLDDVPEQVQ